jgi:hypothetical protein
MNDSWEGRLTVQPSEITEVLNRPISQELLARDLTRLAYVAKDGTPRIRTSANGSCTAATCRQRTSATGLPVGAWSPSSVSWSSS